MTALLRHAPTGLYIALMQDGGPTGGVYYATSPDLLAWSDPAKLASAVGPKSWRCGVTDDAVEYPSLLDPDDPDPSFSSTSDHALLFMTRFVPTRCHLWMNRDLVAVPVAIKAN